METLLQKTAKSLLGDHLNQKSRALSRGKRFLALKVLTLRPRAKIFIIAAAAFSAICGLVAPYFQKIFLDILLGHPPSDLNALSGLTTHQSLLAAIVCAFFGMIISQLAAVILRVYCAREGAILNGQLAKEIYTHALRLTGQARSLKTIGEMVNFFTQDVSAAVALIEDFLPSTLQSIIPLILAPIAVNVYFGIPATQIFLVIFVTSGLLFILSYRQSFYFATFKRLAGERLGIVNEWLQNIRVIRIMGWIKLFEKKIKQKRIEETNNRLVMVTNGSTMNSIAQVAPLILNVVGVAILIKYNHDHVTPGDVFALLWIFGVFLARPIRNLPWTLVIFLDGYTSCGRLEKFFRLTEEPQTTDFTKPSPDQISERTLALPGPGIIVRGLTLQMSGNVILRDISFEAKPGEFVAIIGEVGSGKTQFLMSLLRESPAVFDKYTIRDHDALKMTLPDLRDHFAFAPQDGFTMSASIRDNVTFTYDTTLERDNDVIHSLDLAEFHTRTEGIDHGISTEIGERGVNLSGGQRQRVGLARAHFHNRNIILLDDTLSAVDVGTEHKIMTNLITGTWSKATRILITHRMSALPFADKVYIMENGRLRLRDGTV